MKKKQCTLKTTISSMSMLVYFLLDFLPRKHEIIHLELEYQMHGKRWREADSKSIFLAGVKETSLLKQQRQRKNIKELIGLVSSHTEDMTVDQQSW